MSCSAADPLSLPLAAWHFGEGAGLPGWGLAPSRSPGWRMLPMTRSRTAPRGGFSRTDLAVMTLMGLTLLGLLTPALQGARQNAARDTTVNNLKQMALALHNHND